MSRLQASPFTPTAKKFADPFPLNGECAWAPKQSTAAACRHHTTTHCLYSYGLRAGPRAATTLNYPGTIQGQTQGIMKTGLIAQMLLLSLRRALALSQLIPAENMSIALKEPSQITQYRSFPTTTCLPQLLGAQIPPGPIEQKQKI